MSEGILTKKVVEGRLTAFSEKCKTVMSEDYICGQCAAYPCFRNPDKADPAGPGCFQLVRQCAQECDFYSYKGFPADGGTCKIDGSQVNYEQECHIPEQRTQKKQEAKS